LCHYVSSEMGSHPERADPQSAPPSSACACAVCNTESTGLAPVSPAVLKDAATQCPITALVVLPDRCVVSDKRAGAEPYL